MLSSLVPRDAAYMQVQCLARLEMYRAQRQRQHGIPFLLEDKTGLDGIYLPLQFADWPLVDVVLLIIGLTQISFVKNWF